MGGGGRIGNSWSVTGACMVGSGADSGSDPEMEDELFGAEGGGNGDEWSVVVNRKRKKTSRNLSETDSESGSHMSRKRKEDYKEMMKFAAGSLNAINSLKLSKALREKIGMMESVKTLREEEKNRVKGVISGISPDVHVETMKRNLTGAIVFDVRRLKCTRNNEKVDSLSVMIHFDESKILLETQKRRPGDSWVSSAEFFIENALRSSAVLKSLTKAVIHCSLYTFRGQSPKM
ncbi:Elongation factor 4 [Labeo rohita]|uniref:Elongation factor 4 n=1 Tax=Labeo rohita TaxID=84645 RepID=A0ABQ8L7U3_LABRO|nr:Elongation factor 4 [Labeo rohita]